MKGSTLILLSLSLFVESQCPLCDCQGISTAADPGSVALELCHLMELKGDLGRCVCVWGDWWPAELGGMEAGLCGRRTVHQSVT